MRLLLHCLLMLAGSTALARPHVLVVTATAGYRHESIETAEQVLATLAAAQNAELSFARTAEEVAQRITPAALLQVDAVFFVNTTGDLPLSAATALVDWVRNGGTFAGVHSASDTWHSVPEYLDMLGAEFVSHPPDYTGTIVADDPNHDATRDLITPHALLEEYYVFQRIDVNAMHLLLSLREPEFRPLAWEKTFGDGRVLYTALGHRIDVWQSAWFQSHVRGMMQWALEPLVVKRRAVRH
jgi:type 1 glutamine amidotransferase